MKLSKLRHPWIAAAMSLVLPGLGQIYNGECNKAIWLFLAFALLSVPGIALVALVLPGALMVPALIASVLATLGLWVYGIGDAVHVGRRRNGSSLQPWQSSGVYVLVLVLCDIVALPLLTGYVRNHVVQAFRIPSTSMEPTVMQGDYVFADMRYNCPGCKTAIHRGDIAIFVYPNDRTRLYIKRIIALPGDRIRIDHTGVSVNGKVLASASAPAIEGEDGRQWMIWPADSDAPGFESVVPPGTVFVLGDNRAASVDSRNFGMVPMADVVGRARQVWLSIDHGHPRWHRLGLVLH